MPTSQGTYTPPNNFVQQYDQGQKKIRADLVDENFTDAAAAITQNIADIATAQTAANNAASAAATAQSTADAAVAAAAAATTSSLGTARLATSAEVQAGAASASPLPAVLNINNARNLPKATTSLFGLGRSATAAEASAGATSGTGPAWVTPEQLGARAAYLVETWHSGTEWYRVWSDGWIEQGGCIVTTSSAVKLINLNKPFSNTNYYINVPYRTYDNADGSVICSLEDITSKPKTKTSIYMYIDAATSRLNSGKVAWYACGF